MTKLLHGLHHITAISSDAAQTKHFFGKILGLRLVKKTVDFDDTENYHLYFGNEDGHPGTLLTVFARQNQKQGRIGAGQATIIQLSVPSVSLDFWRARLRRNNCRHIVDETLFGDKRALFQLPDGLLLAMVERTFDSRAPWLTEDVDSSVAIRGIYGITLAQQSTANLPALLTNTLGYVPTDEESVGSTRQYRFVLPDVTAGVIDVQIDPNMVRGKEGIGTIHHFAFDAGSSANQQQLRQLLIDAGMQATEIVDRRYFGSVYARTPGGILIEIAATKQPGFTIDEDHTALGSRLCLPPRMEPARQEIEAALPLLD